MGGPSENSEETLPNFWSGCKFYPDFTEHSCRNFTSTMWFYCWQFNHKIKSTLDSEAPLLIKTRPAPPWRNTEIKKLRRETAGVLRGDGEKFTMKFYMDTSKPTILQSNRQESRISKKIINEHKNNQKFLFSTTDLLTNTNFNRSSKTPTDALCEDFADHFRSQINDIGSSLLPQQILNVDTPGSLILPEETLESLPWLMRGHLIESSPK